MGAVAYVTPAKAKQDNNLRLKNIQTDSSESYYASKNQPNCAWFREGVLASKSQPNCAWFREGVSTSEKVPNPYGNTL